MHISIERMNLTIRGKLIVCIKIMRKTKSCYDFMADLNDPYVRINELPNLQRTLKVDKASFSYSFRLGYYILDQSIAGLARVEHEMGV